MGLLQRILECDEDEVDKIIDEAIKVSDKNAIKVDTLGFISSFKTNSVYQGFIPLKTRIKYSLLGMEDYGMETTDFMHEFAHFIKEFNIDNKKSLVNSLEYFINDYFGLYGKAKRETIFDELAWKTTETDDEYFEALQNNKIGDLKGEGAAQCTERAALAQQILSLFGFESYYCMGCIERNGVEEAHSFNIVKRKNDYALLDYSVPVSKYDKYRRPSGYLPFIGDLSKEDFLDFAKYGTIKSFQDYRYIDGNKELKENPRTYVVGKFKIEKDKEDAKSK